MSRAGTFAMQADRFVDVFGLAPRFVGICLLLLVAEGCQQRPTTVSGTITLDGRPLAVASDARGTVVFQPDGGRGTMAVGLLDSTGHFRLATGSSKEVAPGKYYVSVSVAHLLPKSEREEQGAELVTPAKYASPGESGLEANVVPGQNQFSFDLSSSADEVNSDASGPTSDKADSSGDPPASNQPESIHG
jgi:hypothetical protein